MGPGGIRVKNGKQLVLTYSTTAGNTWRGQTEQIVQQELGQIGVKIVIQNYPANTFFGTILYKGQFQIAEYQATPGPDPDLRTYRADSCQAFPPYGSNYGFWCNQTVNKLLAQEEQITNIPQRKAIFAQISQIENQQMPSLFYYVPKAIDATYGIKGYIPNSVAPVTSTVAQWQLTQ
jgi:peptide/nickel transport system substrate-binding protein